MRKILFFIYFIGLLSASLEAAYDPTSGTGGGDVFTNGLSSTKLNKYNTSVTNDFRLGVVNVSELVANSNSATYATIFGNVTPDSRVTFRPVGLASLAGGKGTVAITGPTTVNVGDLRLAIYEEGGRGAAYTGRGIAFDNTSSLPFTIQNGGAINGLQINSSFATTSTNFIGFLNDQGSSLGLYGAPVFVSSNLVINGNTTLGSQSASAITANASTMAIPNNFNIGSGILFLSNANGNVGIGTTTPANHLTVNTPGLATNTAAVFITAAAATDRALILQGAAGQSANMLELWLSNSVTAVYSINSSGRATSAAGFTSSGTTGGSVFGGGTAVNGQLVTINQGAIGQTNLVINGIAGATGPNVLINDTNGNVFVKIAHNSITFGTNGTAFATSPANTYTIDPPSIPASSTFYTNATLSGVQTLSALFLNSDIVTSNLLITCQCTNNGIVTIGFHNPQTVGAIDPASQTVRVRAFQP